MVVGVGLGKLGDSAVAPIFERERLFRDDNGPVVTTAYCV